VARPFVSVPPSIDPLTDGMIPLWQLILWLICLAFGFCLNLSLDCSVPLEKSEGHRQIPDKFELTAPGYCKGRATRKIAAGADAGLL
jgi:hypothetical protein